MADLKPIASTAVPILPKSPVVADRPLSTNQSGPGGPANSSPLNRRSMADVDLDSRQNKDDFLKALGAGTGSAGSATAVKENVDIYVMPKEFQKHNRVVSGGNKSGMVVMVMGVVLLLVVGGVTGATGETTGLTTAVLLAGWFDEKAAIKFLKVSA